MPERLKAFISSDVSRAWLDRYAEQEIDLHAESLIQLEFCGPKELPQSDWIFVSSKNAAQFLWDHYPNELQSRKLAAVGRKTANYLENLGLQCDFSGSLANTSAVGADFKKVLANLYCLFPTSDKTSGKVFADLDNHQFETLELYRTREVHKKLPRFDLLMFTSPANVSAFISQNKIPENTKIWSIGPSTAESLVPIISNTLRVSSLEDLLQAGLRTFNNT
jgi:uroporphyrinogen-III synthase